ncbi:MAG: hypothetical protein JXR81_04915 [Candidatus Goldbacteria bacterium]|nr:hypothetical protein [Candidatus Goldiibacteriota bacterium]
MGKIRLMIKSAMAAGLITGAIEVILYMVYKDAIATGFPGFPQDTDRVLTPVWLAVINLIFAFAAVLVFQTVNKALPGGFFRKGLNFSFILILLRVLPEAGYFYAAYGFADKRAFFIILLHCAFSLITGFVFSGSYEEFGFKTEKNISNMEDSNEK